MRTRGLQFIKPFMMWLCVLGFSCIVYADKSPYPYQTREKEEALLLIRPSLKAGLREVSLLNSGIRFRPFADGFLCPIPLPGVSMDRKNGEACVIGKREFWRMSQVRAYWTSLGFDFIIAEVTLAPIKGSIKGSLQVEPLETLYTDLSEGGKILTSDEFKKWANQMFGVTISAEPLEPKVTATAKIFEYPIEGEIANRMSLYRIHDSKNFDRSFVVLFYAGRIKEHEKAIQSFLDGFVMMNPTKKTTTQKGRYDVTVPHLNFLRKLIQNSIRDYPGWSLTESQNILLLSNSSKRKEQLICDDGEAIYQILSRMFQPNDLHLIYPLVVRIFDNRQDYLSFVGKERDWSKILNYHRGVASSPLSFFNQANREEEFFRGYHDCLTRQYFDNLGIGNSALWFKEGTAGLMVHSVVKGGKATLVFPGGDPQATGKRLGKKYTNVSYLLGITYEDYWKEKTERTERRLGVMALMYYLYKVAPMQRKYQYAAIPYKFVRALRQTGDAKYASESAWFGIDKGAFSRDFYEFMNSKTSASKLKSYDFLNDIPVIYKQVPERYELPEKKKEKK